jgi:Tol biopolymer transport system component
VRDRVTGQVDRVPRSEADFGISANGRFVAFTSSDTNLVPGDTNKEPDIFVYDRQTAKTERVNVSTSGAQANKISLNPSISADGRYVAFVSLANNLVPNSNLYTAVYVRDRQTGTTTKVSVNSNGVQGNDHVNSGTSISADGRFVVFGSLATNLVPGDTNGTTDVFVRDLQLGKTTLVSVNSNGVQGDGASNGGVISADGHHVVFTSNATQLVPGDTNFVKDIFVHNRDTGQTERVSVASSGKQADQDSVDCAISADGRYVAFSSAATNLVAGDSNGLLDVFWHDTLTGKTERASVASNGAQANGESEWAAISGDGQFVAYYSLASNLAGNDPNSTYDVYLHEPGGPDGGPETVGYTLRPTSIDFGNIPVSRFTSRNFFLKNTGNVPLTIASVGLQGPNSNQFSLASDCGSSVGVGVACRLRVFFQPTSVGKKTAQLQVVAGGKPPRLRNVSGTGT